MVCLLFGYTTLLSYLFFKIPSIPLMTLVSAKDGLESLDLKIKCFNGKLSVDVYSKPTNSSTHVMSTACHPMKNINKVPQGIA